MLRLGNSMNYSQGPRHRECMKLIILLADPQGPGDQAVEEVHAILRQIVGMVLNSQDCALLQRYIVLKREIATVAAASLEKVQD